ncbi:hypothetical protein [Pontibacter vulgaris]|uniref:hypothetical protein n=1 Tax=Pontibacter vulgaris TaxID=2905679 RepID=UPI001FA7EA72|nr:hypothetical protein [Pontibacter vulgaris]
MASTKKNASTIKSTQAPVKTIKKVIMRKNQKVAHVSIHCKLNMLVPQLKSLSTRMQAEQKHDKAKNGNA